MTVRAREYQNQLNEAVLQSWGKGNRNVLAVLPTGGGKTVTVAKLIEEKFSGEPSCTVAHRQELVGQVSTTMARVGIEHNIIAPQAVINFCVQQQIKHVGKSLYHPKAPTTVAGVNTLIRRFEPGERWGDSVKLWVQDECHHVLSKNQWGKAVDLFPNALGLGVTATPIRADGRSLHADQGGVFHDLVQGVSMQVLTNMGALTPYRVIAPKPSIDEAELKIGATGDFTDKSSRTAAHKSEIVGDAVKTYMQFASGQRCIAFTVDVKQAEELAKKYRDAGIAAAHISGDMGDGERQNIVDKFSTGQIDVICNCSILGEGFDVPACSVVQMLRPTMSFSLFCQQFGRCLRPANGKTHGIVIDQVGNVLRMAEKHGMPDTPRRWQLWKEGGEKVPRNPDAIPMRSCDVCTIAFEATTMTCPYCGHVHLPDDRDQPKQVDGILAEMSPELLERLRMAKAEMFTEPAIPFGASDAIVGAKHKQRAEWVMAQNALADSCKFFGGVFRAQGWSDSKIQAKFFHTFQIDIMTAQTLKAKEALALRDQINRYLS